MRASIHSIRPGWSIPVVFLASIFITVLFWSLLPSSLGVNESSDYTGFYEPVAHRILSGYGLTLADGSPATRYPPGYPFLLSVVFGTSSLLRVPVEIVFSVFTLLCVGLASLFVFFLARSVWGVGPALISSLVWMTYPFALWQTKQPNSEVPFLAFFYGGFCLLWYALLRGGQRWFSMLASGMLLGFASLIRPISMGVVLVLGAVVWYTQAELPRRTRLLLVIVLLIGNLMVVLPWEAWVYANTGKIVPLSTNGASSMWDGLTFGANSKGYRQAFRVSEDVTALMEDVYARRDDLQSTGDLVSFVSRQLQTRPAAVAKLFWLKIARSWYGTDSGRYETLIVFIQIVYLALALCGSLLAWKQGGASRRLAVSIWLMVVYFWGMTILALSILRYMVPAMGLLLVLIPSLLIQWPAFWVRLSPSANARLRKAALEADSSSLNEGPF